MKPYIGFKPGKLYKCPEYFLMIYPSKEKAAACTWAMTARTSARSAARRSAYWTEQLNCRVDYSKPGEIFMLLERDGIFLHVLFGEKQEAGRSGPTLGWIIYKDWLNIVEAQNDA